MTVWKSFKYIGLTLLLTIFVETGIATPVPTASQDNSLLARAKNLPPDVHPETLSRMPPLKREDLSTDGERLAYDRVVADNPRMKGRIWLGPTGTRLLVPELAETYDQQMKLLKEKGDLEPKYLELAAAIAMRESDYKGEWLNHQPDRSVLLEPAVEEILLKNGDISALAPKEAVMIKYGRELFRQPVISSVTFAEMERTFGRKETLAATLIMCYFASDAVFMRAYDQHMDASPTCNGYRMGCINERSLLDIW
jgi:hypothetical protein